MIFVVVLLLKSPKFFFFKDAAPPEIYTLPLHDALPISSEQQSRRVVTVIFSDIVDSTPLSDRLDPEAVAESGRIDDVARSEEHTSELQSRLHLVCRLLLEKKNNLES